MLVGFQLVGDGLAGVVYGGVVFFAALLPDGGQAGIGVFLCKVHRDLACLHHLPFAGVEHHLLRRNLEIVAHGVDDVVHRDFFDRVAHEAVDDLLGHFDGDGLLVEHRLCHQRVHYAFQFTDVVAHVGGDVLHHIIGESDAIVVQLLADDGGAGRKVGRLQVCRQAPLETRQQAVFHALKVGWELVAGDDNLLVVLLQVVEYVEENRENLPDMEIGDVFWATENLKYDFHDTVNAKNACYRDVPRYCEMYGTLYDYRTALKACPDGSRLPKYGEVENLLQYYGGAGKNAADSLLVMNDYERDVFGFQALLGGNGEYEGLNENTAMWISSDDSSGTKYVLWIDSSTAEIRPYSSELAYVRCVFDVDSLAAIQEYDVMSDSRDDQLYHYTNVSFVYYIDNEMVTTRMRQIYVLVENVRYKGDSLYSWNDAVENACPEGWRLPNIYEWISIFRSHGDDPSFVLSEDSLQTVVYYNVGRTDYPYYELFGKDKKNTYWTSTEGVFVNSLGENVSAGQVVNMNTAEHNRYDVRMLLDDKLEKHSVRCVKDADSYNY